MGVFELIVIGGCLAASLSELVMREADGSRNGVVAGWLTRQSAMPLREDPNHADATGFSPELLS
jgi:hypothetical protein